MIQPIKDFVAKFIEDKHFTSVLEIGSRDVGPGSIKPTFEGHYDKYVGLDMIDGKDVDIVDDAENLSQRWPEETFDLVVCLETLEHVKNPVKIVEEMKKVLKKGGWMIITTPGTGHGEHGWPSDYYRFWENTYRDVFFDKFIDTHFETKSWPGNFEMFPDAIFGYGKKP